jgi:transcriptional regulator with PAS, ATPase and Fis domain
MSLAAIIGESPALTAVKTQLARLACRPASTVLLTGETGTGKALVARAIHGSGSRAHRPLTSIVCSALPDTLLESELFGYEAGAFTDARRQKRGLLEIAHGGTVLFDEVGEMTCALQAKLLWFLEERTCRRIGGTCDIPVDVRVIATTNRDLEAAVAAGTFRADLLYRLQVMPLTLPPLRERTGDVALLAAHFVERCNQELGLRVRGVTPEALALLDARTWPGNVRELRNVIERAMLLTNTDELLPADLASPARDGAMAPFVLPAGGVNLRDLECGLLVQALKRAGGNHRQAGSLLGINRDQVRYRIAKFGLSAPEPVPQ